jgi:hypothetical protein
MAGIVWDLGSTILLGYFVVGFASFVFGAAVGMWYLKKKAKTRGTEVNEN